MISRLWRCQRPLSPAAFSAVKFTSRPSSLAVRQFHGTSSCRRFDVPVLFNQSQLTADGIPNLLGSQGFTIAWVDYHQYLVDKLNELVAGTVFEKADLKPTVIQTAREPHLASIFNYASMAWNNHFFFEGLDTTNEVPEQMPVRLEQKINEAFGSVDTLRMDMLNTANSMFGPGFVWLVKVWPGTAKYYESDWTLRILATYNAGSPLSGAHYRRQPLDMNTQAPPQSGSLNNQDFVRQNVLQNTAGFMGPYAGARANPLAPGGADLEPLLCVNTWEHVWLRDWQVTGKADFLAAWWKRVDWNKVAYHASLQTTAGMGAGRAASRAPHADFLTT